MSKLTFAHLTFNADNTPISAQFDDIYFSTQDGLAESRYVFLDGNQLWEKWRTHPNGHFVIAETGFGTGLNFFATAALFCQFRRQYPESAVKRLFFLSFEKYPLTATQLTELHTAYPEFAKFSLTLTACWQPHQTGCQRIHFDDVVLDLWFGDIAENLPQLGDRFTGRIDAWFLDGFSPSKNPEMWNDTLYHAMYRLTKNGGTFATFTAASQVRRGLEAAGFAVFKRKGFGKKREMLWGEKAQNAPLQAVQFPYFFANSPCEPLTDIAIVGGGVASLFAALSLLERGKKITLYCQDAQLAENASGNAQGAIYPQLSDDDERNTRFYVHCIDYALQRLRQLSSQVAFEQDLSGVALYAYNEKTAEKFAKIAEQGWSEDLFSLKNAAEFSEKIGLTVPKGGAFIAQGGWLSPVQLVRNGFAYLEKCGLKIVLNHQVNSPQFEQGVWQWQWQGETFRHQALVLANGHCLRDFTQTAGIPLYPVRGLVSQMPTNAELEKLRCVVCYDGYLTPKSAQNTHCIGASHWRDNADTAFSLAEHQENFAKLAKNITACWAQHLDASALNAKVGVRAALRDRIPMVGAVGDFAAQKTQYAHLYNQLRRKQAVETAQHFANLYCIAGLGSRGLTTAPLLGELLASEICGEPLPLSQDLWHALAPNRTWIRKLLKGVSVKELEEKIQSL